MGMEEKEMILDDEPVRQNISKKNPFNTTAMAEARRTGFRSSMARRLRHEENTTLERTVRLLIRQHRNPLLVSLSKKQSVDVRVCDNPTFIETALTYEITSTRSCTSGIQDPSTD